MASMLDVMRVRVAAARELAEHPVHPALTEQDRTELADLFSERAPIEERKAPEYRLLTDDQALREAVGDAAGPLRDVLEQEARSSLAVTDKAYLEQR